MIAVIFEVEAAPDQETRYLELAAALRPELEATEGFISVERFRSLADPEKVLSLSFFADEEALMRWRSGAEHRAAQAEGRNGVFADYRLRVAEVRRDYSLARRAEAPADSRAHHGA